MSLEATTFTSEWLEMGARRRTWSKTRETCSQPHRSAIMHFRRLNSSNWYMRELQRVLIRWTKDLGHDKCVCGGCKLCMATGCFCAVTLSLMEISKHPVASHRAPLNNLKSKNRASVWDTDSTFSFQTELAFFKVETKSNRTSRGLSQMTKMSSLNRK